MANASRKKSCFCWNGCDDALHKCIDSCKQVQELRKKLLKKRYEKSIEPLKEADDC